MSSIPFSENGADNGEQRLDPVLLEDFADFSDELTEPWDTGRVMCERCVRPQTTCLCDYLPEKRFRTETQLLILQHPREEIRGLRTVPILRACLAEDCVKVFRSKRFPVGRCASLDRALKHPDTVVLFPAKEATDISLLPPPVAGPRTLIVLDGTWKQAKGLYVQNERLRSVPAVSLSSSQTSAYIIRTQPTDAALSTLESAALALSTLDKTPDLFEAVVRPLRALCDIQLQHGAQIHHSKETLLRMEVQRQAEAALCNSHLHEGGDDVAASSEPISTDPITSS